MWLLPHLSAVCTAAVRIYYRASCSGEPIPRSGPVLLVGNHPNSLLDPAFLAWVAGRPVCFLAKEPLFRDPFIGWLIRASGSLPVYRTQDDPAQTGRNRETFRAVHDALGDGSAVAIFPEGISHDAPGLAPLKTGAARIALAAAARTGAAFPIIPVGLVFREKDIFRSEAHAVVGAPVSWDDLAVRADDRSAVRELTERIEAAMRTVTLNLARWEDDAVIRTAEAVWSHERDAEGDPGARIARLSKAAEVLAQLRANGDPHWDALARDVREYGRILHVLRMTPADVTADIRLGRAARWVVRRLSLLGIAQGMLAAVTALIFWIPYRLTGILAGRMSESRDALSTYRVLGGTVIFMLWIIALGVMTGVLAGRAFGMVSLLLLPVLAVGGLYATERWQETLATARRWFILRRGDPRLAELRQRQVALAARLDAALENAERNAVL